MSSDCADPVLIFTMARSRSSLVAATVADALDAWTGRVPPPRSSAYPRGIMENRPLVDLQREWFGRGWVEADAGRTIETKPGWRAAVVACIRDQGYAGGPWLFKLSAMYWRPWVDAFPGATLITVRRHNDAILASARRHNGNIASRKVLRAHAAEMERLRDGHGAIELWPADRPGDVEWLYHWLRDGEDHHAISL